MKENKTKNKILIITKETKNNSKEIFQLIKEAESSNQYYKTNLQSFDNNYLITPKDIKLFNFIFKQIFTTLKYKNIQILFNYRNKKIISKQNPNKIILPDSLLNKIKYIIPKFLNFCLVNNLKLSKYFNISLASYTKHLLKLAKLFFLNDFINENDIQMIIFIQIILSLYKNNEKTNYIQNIKQIYLITNYLLSYCSFNSHSMTEKKIGQFNQIVNFFIDTINEYILLDNNYINKNLLARKNSFYKIIGLSRIVSISSTSKIIKLLVNIFTYQLNIDYVLNDLSEQFLFRTKKEKIINKTNLLIAKDIFINDLLEKEKSLLKGEEVFIKNGFFYSDHPHNGIECGSINKFPNENDGYSIVVSFRLMANKENDKSKYTIFSIMNKENNLIHVFIEDNLIKLRVKKEKKAYELYKIFPDSNYVLWIIQSKIKKHKMIFLLNNTKNIINSIYYPEGYYTINIGFSNCNNANYSSKDNFVGIIGTFILFKKCLIKDENDNINVTKLTELKGNYEDIIYINTKREWAFIDKNINLILNKMSNDINIYNDIEIIISTKSLGNIKLINDTSYILSEIKNELYCNYFKNTSIKNEPKFYFKNKKALENNLNFAVGLHNTFIDFLNNHIFLYLQLELYYFISLISSQISEIKDENQLKKFKIFKSSLEEEDFYLNISKICSLFFFCLDSFNSQTCLNNTQEKMIQYEIDNFKYTLIDLVSIYSKYGCKIKSYFLSLFVQKISEKKYFEYCIFILTIDFYDINNNEVFDILFNYLNHISIEYCDNNQIKQIFLKLITFDKIYLNDEIKKSTKKEYSKLIRSLMKIIVKDQVNECYSPFRKRLKKLKENLEKNNMFNSVSNIQEEEYNNENDKKVYRNSFDDTNNNINDNNLKGKHSSRKVSLYKKEKENEESKSESNTNDFNNNENNLDILILIYKYLKNLYISINDSKKNFVESCNDRIYSITEFFNRLFSCLCEIYPIEEDDQYLKFESSEKDKKEIIIAELIKSLCIRFLDDLYFEENIKKIKEEESKKHKNSKKGSRKGSSGSLKKSFNSCEATIKSNPLPNNRSKNSFKKTGSSNSIVNFLNNTSNKSSFISNNNLVNTTVEGIITNKMEFFDKIILSQYTFKSFYVMLFRELSNEKKIKIIKDDKKLKKTLLLTEKNFPKTRYYLRVIISLFEKQNSDGYDTLFMSKIQLIQYSYNIFIDLLKNMLDNYLKSDENKRKKLKPMINTIFVEKGYYYSMHKFYKIMIDNNICNFNFTGCSQNKQNYDLIKDYLDKLLIQVQNDIRDFINNTLFELIDPFYFRLLAEIYFENDINNEFIINVVITIMEKIITRMEKNKKNRIIEINSKNIIILLYKMIFFVNKRNILLYTENELFIKKIIFFLSQVIEHCNILYTKILFPIEDSRGKLLIEMLYEMIFEMYLDFLRNPKIQSLQISNILLKSLFNEKNIQTNLIGHIKHKHKGSEKIEIYTPFYIMDKISYFTVTGNTSNNLRISDDITISKQFYDLKEYILLKYKDEIEEDKELFSGCIIFCIKIIFSINEIEEYYKNNKNVISSQSSSNEETTSNESTNISTNVNIIYPKRIKEDMFLTELKTQFVNLCKNILKIHIDHTSSNPFKCIGYYAKNIYEYFRSFIVDKFSFTEGDPNNKIEELIKHLNDYKRDIKFFERVIYTKDGRTKLYTEKMFNQILKTLKNEPIIKDNDSVGSFNDKKSITSSEGRQSIPFNQSLKGSFINNNDIGQGISSSVKSFKKIGNAGVVYLNSEGSKSQNQIFQKKLLLNKSLYNNNNGKYVYNPTIKFIKDLIRTYFSTYFKKLLTYDEDFINIKNLYILTYNKEIKDIDKYGILYPTRLKNYISNNYNKIFLKRDFNFFTDGYFEYSHKYIYDKKNKYNYKFQNKLLFPEKKLMEENDSAHKDISLILNDLIIYECEMITIKGSIFGYLYVFDNCLLFKSELKNDKRKKLVNSKVKEDYTNYLDYACCTIDYDHLNANKRIILEYNNIKEVVNRTFFFSWISLEIFLKDGKSFYFNLFNEETNDDLLEFLKQKKLFVIRKISEFFKKEEYSKKWREEKITTFDYLLLLNKFSSRTYNDLNQYPILPWLFLVEGPKDIRNFDIPISVQDQDKKDNFLSKTENFMIEENTVCHGNHYSTSAYTLFYLMRANPFTNNMIKFQSNSFDIPDRQYSDMSQTIFLCQKMNNNREMIPELFSIPEIYINLNDNDFGKQKDGVRVHNISFSPYGNNSIDFIYLIKDLINNNIEINNQINKWFDFIFGVNQLGSYSANKNLTRKDKDELKSLRKFNSYCYGQFYNHKKVILEAQKQNKSNKELYDDIKMTINIAINFGQCPYQLLNEPHTSKHKYFNFSDNCSTYSTHYNDNLIFGESNINSRYNSVFSNKSIKEKENQIIFMMNKKIDDIYKIKGNGEIIYFSKSSNNNYLYALLNNRIFEIYKYDIKKNVFTSIKQIIAKCKFLFLKKSKKYNLIFKPKYLFCEINENIFIFCRTLDKTLIYYNYNEGIETSFVLKSYTTSILNINNSNNNTNNNEFITGHDNGRICKWKINFIEKVKKVELELLEIIKSNKNSITCLLYNEKLNIIISCDINTIVIRKKYDFEYFNSIDIKNKENFKKYIVEVKINDYNFIYALIYIEEKDLYELQGFTLNGTYFGNYVGNISNFEITKTGKIIIGEINNPYIKILNPSNFNEVYFKVINIKGENTYYHFYFERPNIIYYGVRDNDNNTRIKILFLDNEEEKYFT